MKKIFYFAILSTALWGCQEGQNAEQPLEQLDKTSAREVVLSSKTVGDTVYHLTTQKIWANNQLIAEKVDTLQTVSVAKDSAQQAVPIYVTIQ